jgi:purine-binding chemotaxis protein CheW
MTGRKATNRRKKSPTRISRNFDMTEKNTKENGQYLTFTLDGEEYAIPVTSAREVLLVPKITRIPRMPEFMRGIVNIRGTVVPILDLKKKFGMNDTAMSAERAIIVVEIPVGGDEGSTEILSLGLFADTVKKVVTIPEEAIDPPPKIGTSVKSSFILGMGRVDGEFIIILDIAEIFSDQDLALTESIREEAEETHSSIMR